MKILYLSIGMASSLYMSLELSRRLVAAGHRMIYASHADIEAAVRAEGHDFIRLQDPPRPPTLRFQDLLEIKKFIAKLAERRRLRRLSIEDDQLERLLHEIEPDRIVADIELHVAVLKISGPATRQSIPLLLSMVFFSLHKAPGRPPLHSKHLPASSWPGRVKIELLWLRLRLETQHFEWKQRLRRLLNLDLAPPIGWECFDIDDLRAVARAHGFSLRRETSRRDWLRPFFYTRLPILCFNAREMDWPQEPPRNLSYVGPMVQENRHEAGCDSESWQRWRQFSSQRGSSRPLIYASLGSFWSADLQLLRQIVEIFERNSEWDLVLGLGGKLERAALGPMPANVLVLDWAPQVAVLNEADAAIVHGGVATLNECARLGVPMVIHSTGFVEQNGNAARVGYHGLGLIAPTPQDIEGSISQALTDPTIRRRLDALAESFLPEQDGLAVQLIEAAEVLPH